MSVIAVDACVLLNLLATGREAEVVRAHGFQLITTQLALDEVLYLNGPADAGGVVTRIRADWSGLAASGVLTVVPPDATLDDALVEAAGTFDDPDASVVALAHVRHVPLWTDDAFIRKRSGAVFPGIAVRGTLRIMRDAFSRMKLPVDEQRLVATALHVRGNFDPPKADPDGAWFASLLGGVRRR